MSGVVIKNPNDASVSLASLGKAIANSTSLILSDLMTYGTSVVVIRHLNLADGDVIGTWQRVLRQFGTELR